MRDIADAIAAIKRFTLGMDAGTFRADSKTVAAVERKLQVISEAATRLGDQAEALCPGLPWRDIRGIGNWLRHQYDHVDVDSIWETVTDDLPPLESAVLRALQR
ncbi:MAG TPA: HepT-like ribonuclease domain-containing protein [Bryobacteraceae bacterium]|nr:HepT-like ribonuclease domain-containing protein [Bryobacteraceae bacterium]